MKELKPDVWEYYEFYRKRLADKEEYGIEWHLLNLAKAIRELNDYIESHHQNIAK